jgi:hypothetical protein
MNTQVGVVIKVLFLSISLSIFIKYGGVLLPIKDTTPIGPYSLIAITLPSLILAIALWIRSRAKIKNN